MVNLFAWLLIAVSIFFAATSSAQELTATVDNTEIVRGDTVTLTIRIMNQTGGVEMDLSPLETGFQLISTRTSTQMRTVNNVMESWVDYTLTLFPLNEGEVAIPALPVAGGLTEAITINVQPRSVNTAAGQELFMEALASKDTVYVQEQVIFTIRLYYTINGIRNPNFTELEMPDAVIQSLGNPIQYERLVDGVRYGIYERQYAIFPQRSGTLEIPEIMFRGEVTDGSRNYAFRNMNSRTITSFAEGNTITVREKPAAYPQNAVWLPASEITIRERWDNDFSNVRVGDAVHRLIEVQATGLDGAAIPPLQIPTVETVNVYPEAPAIDRSFVDSNVVGRRIESYSMVMTESDTVRVGGVTLPWFDVDTDEIKYAVIEDSAIRVGPLRSSSPEDLTLPLDTAETSVDSLSQSSARSDTSLINDTATPLWVIALAAGLTALLGVLTYLLAQKRSKAVVIPKKPAPVSTPMYRREIAPEIETKAFKEFLQACENTHLPALRLALIGWGRQYFADPDLHNLDELAQRTANSEIRSLCLKLQEALYGQSNNTGDMKNNIARLRILITELRISHKQTQTQTSKDRDYILPPLYKT